MTALARRLGRPACEYRAAAERTQQGFTRFVISAEAGLYDVIDGPGGPDTRLRPNQILAVSLRASPLDQATRRAVLRRCAAALLTSHGLRSLAPDDPDYHGCYEGGVVERDGYHQGPVWPWLLGHYALAHYRVHGNAAAATIHSQRLRP